MVFVFTRPLNRTVLFLRCIQDTFEWAK